MEQLIKDVSVKFDDQLDFTELVGGLSGQAIEWVDGKIIHGGLSFGVSKVPEEYHSDVEAVLNAYLNDDLVSLSETVKNRMNEWIDIPGIDETDEGLIFGALGTAIFTILQRKIENG